MYSINVLIFFTIGVHFNELNVARNKILQSILIVPYCDHTVPIPDDIKMMKLECFSVHNCLLLISKWWSFITYTVGSMSVKTQLITRGIIQWGITSSLSLELHIQGNHLIKLVQNNGTCFLPVWNIDNSTNKLQGF